MSKRTRIQKIKVLKGKDASRGGSPYWDYTENTGRNANSETWNEHPQANPDVLSDELLENAAPSTPQLLMGEAISHLQGRQREVYILTMREDKSLTEVAEILGISKGAADTYKRRAIKFVSQYCQDAIKKGRV